MASPTPAEEAGVPVATTCLRAVPTPGGIRVLLLAADGRTVGEARQGAATRGPAGTLDLDLRALPDEVERVLFRVTAAPGAPRVLLRPLDTGPGPGAAAATEVVRQELAAPYGAADVAGGELRRRGGHWAFRPADVPRAAAAAPGAPADAPPAEPALSATRVPAQGPPPALESVGGAAALPAAMVRRLALHREQVALSLGKYGAAGARARVVLVLDAAGSTAPLYARGVVAELVERTAAVAAHFDAAATVRAWTFATHPARLPDIALDTLPEWLRLHVRAGQFALLGRPRKRRRGLHPDQVDMRLVGIHHEEQRAIAEVRAELRARPDPGATLVVFFTDGGIHRDAEIGQQLVAAAQEPVFWQFVGLGRGDYGVLGRFGTRWAPPVGNVGFFAVDDIARTSDAELYDRLLSGFAGWLARGQRSGTPG